MNSMAEKISARVPSGQQRLVGSGKAAPASENLAANAVSVDKLSVWFGPLKPLRDVSVEIAARKITCVVGESGCGKSTFALSMVNLLPRNARLEAERLQLGQMDLLRLSPSQWRATRGRDISMIFQDPMTSFNPVFTIGSQIIEPFTLHGLGTKREALQKAEHLLKTVGISSAKECLQSFPHELSGGMRQRAMIASALMTDPKLLIADEPTTALDVSVQREILRLLRELQERLSLSIIFITHDFGVVSEIADDVLVMYAGEIVERGSRDQVLYRPEHPYTRALLNCLPTAESNARTNRLGAIPGMVPSPAEERTGCAFAERCGLRIDKCEVAPIPMRGENGHDARCLRAFEPL